MAWFPQMWAAALLLNGRLLRENALQGAEQLGVEIVTALNGGLCPFRSWQALAPKVCIQETGWSRGRGASPPRRLHPLLASLPPVLPPSALPHWSCAEVKETDAGDQH